MHITRPQLDQAVAQGILDAHQSEVLFALAMSALSVGLLLPPVMAGKGTLGETKGWAATST